MHAAGQVTLYTQAKRESKRAEIQFEALPTLPLPRLARSFVCWYGCVPLPIRLELQLRFAEGPPRNRRPSGLPISSRPVFIPAGKPASNVCLVSPPKLAFGIMCGTCDRRTERAYTQSVRAYTYVVHPACFDKGRVGNPDTPDTVLVASFSLASCQMREEVVNSVIP